MSHLYLLMPSVSFHIVSNTLKCSLVPLLPPLSKKKNSYPKHKEQANCFSNLMYVSWEKLVSHGNMVTLVFSM